MTERLWLKKGDIIRLKKGMKVNTNVPRKFVYESEPYSAEFVHTTIQIGEVYQNYPFPKYKIEEKMKDFLREKFGVILSDDGAKYLVKFLQIDNSVKLFDTSIYEGDYVVTQSEFVGGGKKRLSTFAPYCVHCFKKENPFLKVDFYLNTSYITPNINSDELMIVGHSNKK